MLESLCHESNAFLTLTYSDENLPIVKSGLSSDPSTGVSATLNPKHLQDWLKRFRKAIEPSKIRFYAVGEYGDETQRPHYHVALFGYPSCSRGQTGYGQSQRKGIPAWERCCAHCRLVGETWGLGSVYLGALETSSAQYVAGYVTKKMTSKSDARLNGRHPEFARMSNRPGIGHDFMHEYASELMKLNLEDREADVPSALRHGSRLLPLGRYLRRKLRTMVGKDEKTPEAVIYAQSLELLPLREAAKTDAQNPSLKDQINLASKQAIASVEARHKIFKGKKSL